MRMFATEQFAIPRQPRVSSQGVPRSGACTLASIAAERPLPRFFFHVYDGVSSRDELGTELPDRQTARREAIELAGRVIAEEASRLPFGDNWRMDVTNEAGTVLFKLDFQVSGSAAAHGGHEEAPSFETAVQAKLVTLSSLSSKNLNED